MKHILFVISSLRREGPVIQLLTLIRHLPADRFQAHVLALSDEQESAEVTDGLAEEFRSAGAALYFESLRGWRYQLYGRKRFRALISRVKPDIIQCSGIRADLLAGGLNRKQGAEIPPKVFSVMHNIPWEDYRFTYRFPVSQIMLFLQRRAWSKMHTVVTVSGFVKEEIHRRWPGIPVHAIPNGVDFSRFQPDTPSDGGNRWLPGLNANDIVLLCTDHLTPLKDPLTLIRAFRMLKKQHQNMPLKLVFVGSGPLLDDCLSQSADLPEVLFPGRTGRVTDWYRAANVLVSASQSEGFHLSVAEGLGCGLVPALSRIGVRGEFFREYESLTNPLLFEAGNVAAACDSLAQAVALSQLERFAPAGNSPIYNPDMNSGLSAVSGASSAVLEDGWPGWSAGELLLQWRKFGESFRQRFSARRMAEDYVTLYDGESVPENSDGFKN